jgi:glycine dehydrogenase subunit 2
MDKLLNELSAPVGEHGYEKVSCDVAFNADFGAEYARTLPLGLANVNENDLLRHFTVLSRKNYALSTTFYPLGSCTMKYNPQVNETISKLDGFNLHPLQDVSTMQGSLEVMYGLQKDLTEISGMDAFSLTPAAGAQGEFSGLLIIAAHFKNLKQKRTKIIVPDSAHGTNPASAAFAGFEIIPIKSEPDGSLDIEKIKEVLSSEVAAIMLTVPNTLGVFESKVTEIAEICHANGTLLYYDGANLNAVMGIVRPGDLGFDVMHINLHKTFGAPHGGGGPGSGPVGVKSFLAQYLPEPVVVKKKEKYALSYNKKSVGTVKSFFGNFPVILKAYAYIKSLGAQGLKEASLRAVLNANYLMSKFKGKVNLPAPAPCMHEFVLSPKSVLPQGVHTLDVAKKLLDYGYYAPTIYFPLIVEEAMMIEPTETETKETLDRFAQTLLKILFEDAKNAEDMKTAPQKTPVKRLNEVDAARKPVLKW